MKKPVKFYTFPEVPYCLVRAMMKDYDLTDWRVWNELTGVEFALPYKKNSVRKRRLDHSMPIR